ncbi:MAG: hypothetical protein IKN79_11565 [Eubacterium sp.]|nr:hypothetical protein [Eubacterium sp.]
MEGRYGTNPAIGDMQKSANASWDTDQRWNDASSWDFAQEGASSAKGFNKGIEEVIQVIYNGLLETFEGNETAVYGVMCALISLLKASMVHTSFCNWLPFYRPF